MNRLIAIAGGALLCGCLAAATGDSAGVPAEEQAIDAIFEAWNGQNTPGCAMSVERQGQPLISRSYGAADLEHDIPVKVSSIFEAGSVSKQFTAASVLLLVAQGKLSLTDDVRKYVPELPDYGTPITINELLGHTSGLRDWGDVEAMAGWPRGSRIYTLADALAVAARQKSLNYRPGTAYSYTNTGYNLLAIIVERVSKASLAEFSRQYLFEPLGLTHTQWRDDFRRVVKGRAIAYEATKDGYRQEMPFEDVYGNGGLLTTVGDLLIWNDALTSGKLGHFVTTELQRQTKLQSGQEIAYARGLFVDSYHGVREISHSGATAGYRAWLGRYPDLQISIALLCNAGNASPTKLAHQVADLFLPKQLPPASIILSVAELTPHAGLFVDSRRGLPVRLEMSGDSLKLDGERPLIPTSAREFRVGYSSLRFFGLDRFVLQSLDGDELEYRRVQPWVPSHAEWSALSGRYTSDEALATYRVRVTKEGVVLLTPQDRQGYTRALKPIFADTFQWEDEDQGIVHFIRSAQGGFSGFQMSDSRVSALSFRRIADQEWPR
jgi:CubicO group peptidase (beta-lactamase class C family)